MWDGVFLPVAKSRVAPPGEHREANPQMIVVPLEDAVELHVQFDHECKWPGDNTYIPAPSNSKVYVYLVNLGSGESPDNLQDELDGAHVGNKSMRWLLDSLATGRVEKDPLRDPSGEYTGTGPFWQ